MLYYLSYNPILLLFSINFIAQIFQLWPSKALLVGSCMLSTGPILSWAFHYFVASQNISSSSCKFPPPDQESAISSRNSDYLCWKLVFKSHKLGTRDSHCHLAVYYFLVSSMDRSRIFFFSFKIFLIQIQNYKVFF